jgi:hypothetical protein
MIRKKERKKLKGGFTKIVLITYLTFIDSTKINNLIIKIQNKISEDQSEERTKIIQELDNVEGFLDIESKEKEIEQRLRNIVSDSKYVEELIKTLNYSTI